MDKTAPKQPDDAPITDHCRTCGDKILWRGNDWRHARGQLHADHPARPRCSQQPQRQVETVNLRIRAGLTPPDISRQLAPESQAWTAPALQDFSSKSWAEMTALEQRAVAEHFAWVEAMPPAAFGDMKLGHHDPKTGEVVWAGVAAATARLNQTEVPSADVAAIKRHLRSHYDQFKKPIPDTIAAAPGSLTDETIEIKGAACPAEFELLADGGDAAAPKIPTFTMTAYTGGGMNPSGWYHSKPLVVDLEGMKIPSQQLPIDHEHNTLVGHSTSIDKTPGQMRLKASGVLSGYSPDAADPPAVAARQIVRMARQSFPHQASIDAQVHKVEHIDAGESVKVNGQLFHGPLGVARASTLKGIAILASGADSNSRTDITCQQGSNSMPPEFVAWHKANDYTDDSIKALTPKQTTMLQAAWKPPTPAPAPAAAPAPVLTPTAATTDTFEQTMAAIEAESKRVIYIRERTAKAAESYVGEPDRIKALRELCASAVADQKTDARAFDLALLRCDRAQAPMFHMTQEPVLSSEVLAAAICKTAKLKDCEKKFSDQTMQAAHTKFRRGIGLKELLLHAAERNNHYRGSSRDDVALCNAAFRGRNGDDFGIQAEGESTISVPGILSNVANKFLLTGFLYTEQAYRQICRFKTANDFKQMSTYRLTGANTFIKVPPGGEIKHGTLSQLAYYNQVDTYGIMIGMDRRDIRNDDLGAFTSIPQELGRGAGDALNQIFWTDYLADSTFYPTNGSNNNYFNDAVTSVLSIAGLEMADTIFGMQTKPDGTPLGVMPAVLLVPRSLRSTALNLMHGQTTAQAVTTPTQTTLNIWQGMFTVVSSVYLNATSTPGNSALAWYLLADPNNIATVEVAFLDGVEAPIVENSVFDFDRLGLSMRAYFDFGVGLQEPRGGLKMKGAA